VAPTPEPNASHLSRRQMETVRCPFCVQGDQFRAMLDLTAGMGNVFYCTACRHLIRDDPGFRCLCNNCHTLATRPAKS